MAVDRPMPLEWRAQKLGELASINSEAMGEATPADTEIEYMDITSIASTGRMNGTTRLLWAEAPSRARRIVRAGDIVVSTVRPYLRAFVRVRVAPPNLVASTGFAVLRPTPDVDGDFLYQNVLSSSFTDHLLPRMIGSNYPAVSVRDVADFLVLVPPLPEQRRIAEILSSVDEAIERTETVIERVREVKRALAQELLTRGMPGRHTRFKQTEVGEIPEEWDVVRLGEVAEYVTSGSRGWAKHYDDGGESFFVRITNLKRASIWPDMSDVQMICAPADAEAERAAVRAADVLISITADLGVTCVVPEAFPESYVNQHVALVRLKPGIESLYAGYFLAFQGQEQFRRLSDQGAKLGLNLTSIRNLAIPLPPREEQQHIARGLSQLESRIDCEAQHRRRLLNTKGMLATALLSAQIRVGAQVSP